MEEQFVQGEESEREEKGEQNSRNINNYRERNGRWIQNARSAISGNLNNTHLWDEMVLM